LRQRVPSADPRQKLGEFAEADNLHGTSCKIAEVTKRQRLRPASTEGSSRVGRGAQTFWTSHDDRLPTRAAPQQASDPSRARQRAIPPAPVRGMTKSRSHSPLRQTNWPVQGLGNIKYQLPRLDCTAPLAPGA
jgi:hypothetical protein